MLRPMLLRRVIPAAVFAALIAAAPASAATEAATGPSATPLILEVALAVIVMTGLALRRPASRALVAARRRLSSARPSARSAAPVR
jgi:hypothetical protein